MDSQPVSALSPSLSSSLMASPSSTFLDALSLSIGSQHQQQQGALLSSSSSSLSSNASTASTISEQQQQQYPGTGISNSLNNEIAVHLMLFNSIEIMSRRHVNDEIYHKVTCFDMNCMDSAPSTPTTSSAPVAVDEESMGIGDEYAAEIAVMSNEEYGFHPQAMYGRLLRRNEFVMFRARMPMTEHIGVRVDLFKRTRISIGGGQPVDDDDGSFMFEKIAFCYIYPLEVAKCSDGVVLMPITSRTGKLVARIKAQYFVARPYAGAEPQQMIKTRLARGNSSSSQKAWQLKGAGVDIGHRGAGSARRTDRSEKVLENTVDSFNLAFKQGADMVELDVQISKDKVPVVYHDFNVNIVLQKKDRNIETYPVNIKDLTFDQLQALRTNPVLHQGKEEYHFDEDGQLAPLNQPFASFRTVLLNVDPACGFNVEIKYPQKKINGQWEAEKSHDLNEYVDLVLQDLCECAGERNIIISSFHPELCALVKLKQDRYPVLFLTQGLTKKWMQYENPLNHSIEMATYLALSTGLYGIAAHTEDILRDRRLIHFVKSRALCLLVWGDDLNDKGVIKSLKAEGCDGAIYDKIDLYVSKEDRIPLPEQGQQQQEQAMDIQ